MPKLTEYRSTLNNLLKANDSALVSFFNATENEKFLIMLVITINFGGEEFYEADKILNRIYKTNDFDLITTLEKRLTLIRDQQFQRVAMSQECWLLLFELQGISSDIIVQCFPKLSEITEDIWLKMFKLCKGDFIPSAAWQLQALVKPNDIKDKYLVDSNNRELAHYYAYAGNTEALANVHCTNSQLFYYAALSGNMDTYNWCKNNLQLSSLRKYQLNSKNILHYAYMSGNEEMIETVRKDVFESSIECHEYITSEMGSLNYVKCLALSGNVKLLDKILAKRTYKNSIDVQDLVFFIVEHCDLKVLQYLAVMYPAALFTTRYDSQGLTVLHRAAMSGNLARLKCILELKEGWGDQYYSQRYQILNATSNVNILFIVAKQGDVLAIKWLLENFPKLNITNNYRESLGNYVALSGNVNALDWLRREYPDELEKVIARSVVHSYELSSRSNFLGAIFESGKKEALRWAVLNYPEYVVKITQQFSISLSYQAVVYGDLFSKKKAKKQEQLNRSVQKIFADINSELQTLPEQQIQILLDANFDKEKRARALAFLSAFSDLTSYILLINHHENPDILISLEKMRVDKGFSTEAIFVKIPERAIIFLKQCNEFQLKQDNKELTLNDIRQLLQSINAFLEKKKQSAKMFSSALTASHKFKVDLEFLLSKLSGEDLISTKENAVELTEIRRQSVNDRIILLSFFISDFYRAKERGNFIEDHCMNMLVKSLENFTAIKSAVPDRKLQTKSILLLHCLQEWQAYERVINKRGNEEIANLSGDVTLRFIMDHHLGDRYKLDDMPGEANLTEYDIKEYLDKQKNLFLWCGDKKQRHHGIRL